MSRRLIYGVGVNDADYFTYTSYVNDQGKRIYSVCPYYKCWTNMLSRCYSPAALERKPTYIGCSVAVEWHLFSNFRLWMIEQAWEGNQLDKDILSVGNKVYSPETCVFVNGKVNNFVVESSSRSRGLYPLGVSASKGYFSAECGSVATGKPTKLGLFKTPEEAHQVWLDFKLEQAYILAAEQTDERVAKALISRYEGYKDKLNKMCVKELKAEQAIKEWSEEFAKNQETLPTEFQQVLDDNIWELYEK